MSTRAAHFILPSASLAWRMFISLCTKIGEVVIAPREIVHNEEKLFSHHSGAKATRRGSSVNAKHYKPVPGRLVQMAEHDAVKEKDEGTLKKGCCEDTQQPARFNKYRAAVLDMLNELKRM